jgi:hypothetical protein
MLRSLATPLDALAPIGLDELDACAALHDRVDVKYVGRLDMLDALVTHLAATHRALEIDGRRSFAYSTTYFDTPDLRCYRDHLQRRRRRYKCRLRRYVDAGLDVLEVKRKSARGETLKRRLPLDAAPAALEGELLAFVVASGAHDAEDLRPTLRMAFERMTLVAPDRGERLTCDVGLAFAAPDGGAARIVAGGVIVESKSRRGTALGDAALRALGARPVTGCSKYGLGIALTRAGVITNPYRRLLRRHFEVAA